MADGERRLEGRRGWSKRAAGEGRRPREAVLGPGRRQAGGGGGWSGRVWWPDDGDGGRREERGRGGEHRHEGDERKLTVQFFEAEEHWSRPATEAKGGAGRFTVVAA